MKYLFPGHFFYEIKVFVKKMWSVDIKHYSESWVNFRIIDIDPDQKTESLWVNFIDND